MKNCLASALALGLVAVAMSGCSDPITDLAFESWEPEYALPVANTRFTLRDALQNTQFADYISEDENSALRLTTYQELYASTPGEMLELPTLAIPLAESETRFMISEADVEFDFTQIDFSGGYLVYQFFNDQFEPVTVQLTTSNLTLDGAPMQVSLEVPPGVLAKDSISAAGYRYQIGVDGILSVDYSATTLATNQVVTIAGGALTLRDPQYDYIVGVLPTLEVSMGSDSVELDVLEVFEPGSITLVNPVATIIVDNEVGAPVRLQGVETEGLLRDGTRMQFDSPLSRGFDFDYPTAEEGRVSKRSTLQIDRENSNLVDVLKAFPTAISLALNAQVNGDSLQETFSMYRDARVAAALDIDIPLDIRFNGFELEESFAFDGAGFEQAKAAAFRLVIDNGFGLTAATQVYFYDEAEVLLDSLFESSIVVAQAASLDETGELYQATELVTEVELDDQRLAALKNSSSATVRLRLDTPESESQPTRLFYDNSIGIQLGARITVKPE